MTRRHDGTVGVLDLRVGGAHRRGLDELSRSEISELALGGRLVVVDDAAALVAHHDGYMRLATIVTHVVCVAVGTIAGPAGAQLQQSGAVRKPSVTLWVGDELGTVWAGGAGDGGEPAEPGAFAELLAQLSSPDVFDAVAQGVGTVRYQTACPALRAVGPSVGVSELRGLLAQVVRSYVTHGFTAPPDIVLPTVAPTGGTARAVRLPAEQQVSARPQIDRADQQIADTVGPSGLLRTGGIGAWTAVAEVGRALDARIEHTKRLLDALQRRAEAREPRSEHDWMLPVPQPADDTAIAHELRAAVLAAFTAGASIADVVTALRSIAHDNAGQATGPARRALADLEREPVADALSAAPTAQVPGAVVGGVAAAALVTCGVAAFLPTQGVIGGVVIALLWIGGVLAVLRRRPAPAPPRFADNPGGLLGVAVAAAVGVLAGGLLSRPLPIPLPVELAVDGVLVAIGAVVLLRAWTGTVRRWSTRLALPAARALDDRLDDIVDDTVAGPYARARVRQRLQESAELLATGLTDVHVVFDAWAAALDPPTAAAGTTAAGQVTEVLLADLAALAVTAISGYVEDIAAGGPLRVDDAAVGEAAERLRARYEDYLMTGSLQRPPPVPTDPAVRERLADAMWRRCAPARELLRGDLRVPMTQLCLPEDLRRALDLDWREIRTLRFAPAAAQRVLVGAADPEVVNSIVDSAGLLRLVPMRAGAVKHVLPASAGGATTIGGRVEPRA